VAWRQYRERKYSASYRRGWRRESSGGQNPGSWLAVASAADGGWRQRNGVMAGLGGRKAASIINKYQRFSSAIMAAGISGSHIGGWRLFSCTAGVMRRKRRQLAQWRISAHSGVTRRESCGVMANRNTWLAANENGSLSTAASVQKLIMAARRSLSKKMAVSRNRLAKAAIETSNVKAYSMKAIVINQWQWRRRRQQRSLRGIERQKTAKWRRRNGTCENGAESWRIGGGESVAAKTAGSAYGSSMSANKERKKENG